MLIFVLYEATLFIDPYFIVEETDSSGWLTCPRPTVHKCSAETQTQIFLILDPQIGENLGHWAAPPPLKEK